MTASHIRNYRAGKMSLAADENRTKQAGAKHRWVVPLTGFQTATCEEWYTNLRKLHVTTKRFVASMGLVFSSHVPERKGAGTRARAHHTHTHTHTHTCALTHAHYHTHTHTHTHTEA